MANPNTNLQRDEERTLRIVYYGPEDSGKTTNLVCLKNLAPADAVGFFMALNSQNDRSRFVDLLALRLLSPTRRAIRLKLITVPGRRAHRMTRRILLREVDGIIFVANSDREHQATNTESFRELRSFLRNQRRSVQPPLVIQFNKRDLPNTQDESALKVLEGKTSNPVLSASALHGEGVLESLATVIRESLGDSPSNLAWASEYFEGWGTPQEGIGRL